MCQSEVSNHHLTDGNVIMQITAIGIDLAKAVFQVHGVDAHGKTVLKKQLMRTQMLEFLFGYTVRLMAPQFVKPYVKTNKNDAADTEQSVRRSHGRQRALFQSSMSSSRRYWPSTGCAKAWSRRVLHKLTRSAGCYASSG